MHLTQLDPCVKRKVNALPHQPVPFMHTWRDAVWAARGIGPTAKLVLIRIGCFVDALGRGCSISYKQLAADCDINERTAKSVVAKLQEAWLDVHAKQGRLVPGRGRENLYHVVPQTGVAPDHPAWTGVASHHTNSVRDNQEEKGNSKTPYGTSGRAAAGADTTNVVPFRRTDWASELVTGGVL